MFQTIAFTCDYDFEDISRMILLVTAPRIISTQVQSSTSSFVPYFSVVIVPAQCCGDGTRRYEWNNCDVVSVIS